MSRQGLRTILCCSVSGAGLWAVAAGFLTHHPMAVKLGAAVAVVGALLMFSGAADARELTAGDLKTVEAVNQARNRDPALAHMSRADPVCSVYATNKVWDLLHAGFGKDIALAIVLDEHGQPHEVAEVFGTLKGKPTTIVLDNRTVWTASRQDMEALGYSWVQEFRP